MSTALRGALSLVLLLAGAALLVAGMAALYGSRELAEREAFSSRAVEALRDPDVRRVVTREVAAQITGATGLTAPPELERALERGISSPGFERAFRAAARETHAEIFDREDASVAFDVPGAAALVPVLRDEAPAYARLVPAGAEVRLVEVQPGFAAVQVARRADDVSVLGPLLLGLGIALLAAGVALAPDARAALVRAGVAVAAAAALLAVALVVIGEAVASRANGRYALSGDDVEPAAEGVWSAYAGDLVLWALLLTLLALVVAAAARWIRWSAI
jgi:hypothetical protein